MTDFDGLEDLETEAETLHRTLGDTSEVTAAFSSQLQDVRVSLADTTRDLGNLERGFSSGLRRAFDGVVLDGLKLSDALNILATRMVDTAYSAAVRPVTDHFGGMLANGVNAVVSSLMPFADGGVLTQGRMTPFAEGGALSQGRVMPFADGGTFSQGRVMPFARGGVVTAPTTFPMRGGTGLMGEAGPEAIMPLSRGSDGRLGVRAQGTAPIHVTMNIATPDVEGFARSEGQIAARMARALGRGQRNR